MSNGNNEDDPVSVVLLWLGLSALGAIMLYLAVKGIEKFAGG
jgi:hypothetical protein